MSRPRALAIALMGALLVMIGAVTLAMARPGGGQSFSGSRSSSSSSSRSTSGSPSRPSFSFPSSPSRSSSSSSSRSSSSTSSSPPLSYPSYPTYGGSSRGDSSLTGFFFFLLVGAVVVVLFIAVATRSRSGFRQTEWDTSGGLRDRLRDAEAQLAAEQAAAAARRKTYSSVMEALGRLKSADQDFSQVLFEDFLYALYAEAQTARGGGHLDRLSPYLSERARGAYAVYPAAEVKAIVIGSMRLVRATAVLEDTPRIEATVELEVNYTEVSGSGVEQSYYARERWTLSRSPSARSRAPSTMGPQAASNPGATSAPEKSRVFGCPSCGAPLEQVKGRICSYCSQTVDTGEFDWVVADLEVLERETRGPMLTGTTEEAGTDAPTVVAPDIKEVYQALCRKDPAVTWGAFSARVELIFNELQVAWSSQDLRRVRPYLSDNLFQRQIYWVEAYQRARLKNLTDGSKVATIQLARVVSDRYFDAITVRVFASGLDYTVNEAGEVVSGSRSEPRAYSEYWTLIRGSNRTGAPRAEPVCPNCGAGLDINMAGQCAYCKAKVTTGEFDWVLSRIEQDEAYG